MKKLKNILLESISMLREEGKLGVLPTSRAKIQLTWELIAEAESSNTPAYKYLGYNARQTYNLACRKAFPFKEGGQVTIKRYLLHSLGLRICSTCENITEENNFRKHSRCAYGLANECKKCETRILSEK